MPLSGRGSALLSKWCFSLLGPQGSPPSNPGPLHTLSSPTCMTGPWVTYTLQTGPAQGLGPPVAQEGPFFSAPLGPSQWQGYFGVFASPSPDLLQGREMAYVGCEGCPLMVCVPSCTSLLQVPAMRTGLLQPQPLPPWVHLSVACEDRREEVERTRKRALS